MEDEERPADRAILGALHDLSQKLDTVAGALASIAHTHHDLLDHAAEGEARRAQDATALAQRLDALERQVLNLGSAERPAERPEVDLSPVQARLDELAAAGVRQHDDLVLSLDALARMAEAIDELGGDVTHRVSDHTDAALAGVLRLLDVRLAMLRQALLESDALGGSSRSSGFEAGAVMGAAQAAWTHLEQRLETEFDDLGRQLQAMASVIETVAASTEDLASRPMTSDQLRKAAVAARDAVVSANRTRRDRRGGPRSLGS